MTPGVLEYTEEADEDLLQIHEWLERISPQLADQTIRQLDTECRKVAEAPGLGTRCDEIRPRTLKWIYRKYLIFYEATSEGILVIRVVHGMREMKDLFPKR